MRIAAALLFAAVTAHVGNPLVGAPWFLGALLLVGAAMFALFAMRPESYHESKTSEFGT